MDGVPGARSFSWTSRIALVVVAACIGQLLLSSGILGSFHIKSLFYPQAMSVERQVKKLPAQYQRKCPLSPFSSIQIASRNPQLIIIENFLTPADASFLLKTAYVPLLYFLLMR